MSDPVYPESAPPESGSDQPMTEKRRRSRSRSHRDSAEGRSDSHAVKRSRASKYYGSYTQVPAWKAPWLAVWRRLAGFWKYWKPNQIVKGGVTSSTSLVAAMLRFDGTDFDMERADGRVLVRTWPSQRTLWNPLWWLTNAALFVIRWLTTRHYLPLLMALPALIAAASLIGIISAGSVISPGTQGMLYKRMLAAGISDIDLSQAKLAVNALIRIDPDNLDAVYDRGLIEAQLGNVTGANEIMTELATSHKSANAALWLAQAVGDSMQLASWSRQQILDYHNWLQLAVQHVPDNPRPRRMLGDLRALLGNKQGAYDTLLPIADIDTDTSYLVYFLQKELGHTELASARGEKLDRIYRLRLQEEPQDFNARIQYATLLASFGNSADALALLQEGASTATPEDRLRLGKTTSDILVAEAQEMAKTNKTPRGLIERMSKLKQAVAADPTNRNVLEAVSQACFEAAESKDNELLILRESLVQNIDPDTSHFILGTIALNAGKIAEATQHLELAAKNNPNLPGLLNNLAHAIYVSESPDLERALRYANEANTIEPNHPFLHETRGQIYLKMKRYTDAIADLEVALNAPELRAQAREALAQAYEATGQTEIAKRQREMIQQGALANLTPMLIAIWATVSAGEKGEGGASRLGASLSDDTCHQLTRLCCSAASPRPGQDANR